VCVGLVVRTHTFTRNEVASVKDPRKGLYLAVNENLLKSIAVLIGESGSDEIQFSWK